MNLGAIALLSVAMSTDAFAAAVSKGAALDRPHWREALRTGAIFGCIEAATPVIGWLLGGIASDYVRDWDHWIAFTLLSLLGAKMLWDGLKHDDDRPAPVSRHGFWRLALTGLATSIDAMAVGVGLAFLDEPIGLIALAIGCTTFVAVTLGVMLGRVLGSAIGKRAEVLGGLLLIGIGSAILYEHLTAAAG